MWWFAESDFSISSRSGSMEGSPLANMKSGSERFIDIIDEATDGIQDGMIGSGSHMGIVSFAETAVADTPLTESVADLKAAVSGITAGGFTNHAEAFQKAMELFDPFSSNAKVIVMFTDGKTTAGLPPAPVAAAARASGIVIYCIGLTGSDGIDESVLNDWATDPDDSHVAVTPDDADLETLFGDLAVNISKPGATNIIIRERVNQDFMITSVVQPVKGTAEMIDANTILWKIDRLGVSGNEGATLEFFIRHIGQDSGEKLVNRSIDYSDTEGNAVTFPTPSVMVECGIDVEPEPCPKPVDIGVGGCQDFAVIDLGDTYLESLGRIIELNLTLKHVCPGKRVALGVILTEIDRNGTEYSRGMKTMTIPAHQDRYCRDIQITCIRFVLPQDLDVSGGNENSVCSTRNLKARVIAHYIDTDFKCCDTFG